MAEYEYVSGEELFLLDKVKEFRIVPDSSIKYDLATETCDEGREVADLCEAAKEICGHDIARGFKGSWHVLKYITGDAELPNPVPIPPEDDKGVAICA
jgi:hypothetical protein